MNSLAEYISPNIGEYMKYDTAAGRKASLVDFLKIYFSDEKGRGEERIAEDKEVRASKREGDDNYNNYIRNYDNDFKRSRGHGAPNTLTLADLLPKQEHTRNKQDNRNRNIDSSNIDHTESMQNFDRRSRRDFKEDNPSSKTNLKDKLTLADLPRPNDKPTIKTFLKEPDIV
jgi:hypothetical protein